MSRNTGQALNTLAYAKQQLPSRCQDELGCIKFIIYMKSLKNFKSNALTAPNKVMGGAPNVGDYNAPGWEEPKSGVFPAYHYPAGTWPGDHPGGLPAYFDAHVLGDQ